MKMNIAMIGQRQFKYSIRLMGIIESQRQASGISCTTRWISAGLKSVWCRLTSQTLAVAANSWLPVLNQTCQNVHTDTFEVSR